MVMPSTDSAAAPPEPSTPTPVLDARQVEVMAETSVDGRPPDRESRRSGWRWFLLVAPLVLIALVAGVAWGVGPKAFNGRNVLMAIGVIALMAAAAAPVWGAGLLRGQEERAARKIARRQVGRR